MCFPFAIPLALMAAGATASYAGNKQAQDAQSATSRAEQARQQVFSQRQDALVQNSMDQTAATAGKGLDDATAARQAELTAALGGASPTQDFLPGAQDADHTLADSANKIVATQHAGTAAHADASARLQALGDALFKTNVGVGRNSQEVNQIGEFKQGSAAVLPAELNAAAQKGSGLRTLGQIAMTIGSMAAGGGGLGAAASGAAGAGAGIAGALGTAGSASAAGAAAAAAGAAGGGFMSRVPGLFAPVIQAPFPIR